MKAENYKPINCGTCNAACVQQTLAEQHWETSRSCNRQKMWITGLYLGGVAAVLTNRPTHESLVYFLLGLAGFVAFIAVSKLHFLSELHIAKAQVYLAGTRKGVIFKFHIKGDGSEIGGVTKKGENITPEPDCLCLKIFFGLPQLTTCYACAISFATLICIHLFLRSLKLMNPIDCPYLIAGVIIVLLLLLVGNFGAALKRYARDKAILNLSEGFNDVRRSASRSKEI